MKKFSSLPYLYGKLFKTFSYSVKKWVEMEKTDLGCRKRTTQADFIVTREYDKENKYLMTWATTKNIVVKLELRHEENKRVIVIKYGESGSLTPQQLQTLVSNTAGARRINDEIRIMIEELLKQDFIR